MRAAKAFFDTNILLHLYGGGDPAEQAKAVELFEAQTREAGVVVSTQVVQEFYAVATCKLGMARDVAGSIVRNLLDLPLAILGADSILTALAIEERDVRASGSAESLSRVNARKIVASGTSCAAGLIMTL
jgi:predicted nucleic acid-binding protein